MNKNGSRAKNGKRPATPAFVVRAERALRRAARNVQSQNRKLGLPLILWQNGKLVEKPASQFEQAIGPLATVEPEWYPSIDSFDRTGRPAIL
jgi:hypothetical protein